MEFGLDLSRDGWENANRLSVESEMHGCRLVLKGYR